MANGWMTGTLVVLVTAFCGCLSKGGAASDGAVPTDGGTSTQLVCADSFGVTQVEPGAVDNSSRAEAYVFDPAAMHRFDIRVDPADLAKLDADPRAEEYVPATVRFEGFEYRGAALRYKGGYNTLETCFDAAGVFDVQKCRKLSLKLSFNECTPGGRFFGLRKIVLNSMSQDPTLLHERLGSVFRRAAGVHAPRISYATASINDVDRGVFALVEEVDKEFLRETYGDTSGDLYKSVWPRYPDIAIYKQALETNRNSSDGSTMLALYEALSAATEATFAQRTAGLVDAATVARRLAVGYIVADNDGPSRIYCFPDDPGLFCANANYYWYNQPGHGFDLISWDFDGDFWYMPKSLALSVFTEQPASCDPISSCEFDNAHYEESQGCGSDGSMILPPACDPLMRLSVATNAAAYQAAIDAVAAAYADGTILGTVDAAVVQLGTVIADERAWGVDAAQWQSVAAAFREQIVERGRRVQAAATP